MAASSSMRCCLASTYLDQCLQLGETVSIKLDGLCCGFGVKLLMARSYGLVGYLRVSTLLAGNDTHLDYVQEITWAKPVMSAFRLAYMSTG